MLSTSTRQADVERGFLPRHRFALRQRPVELLPEPGPDNEVRVLIEGDHQRLGHRAAQRRHGDQVDLLGHPVHALHGAQPVDQRTVHVERFDLVLEQDLLGGAPGVRRDDDEVGAKPLGGLPDAAVHPLDEGDREDQRRHEERDGEDQDRRPGGFALEVLE